MSNVTPIKRASAIETVGGLPDEVRVTLAFYGEELIPESVSQELGCNPTKSRLRGDRSGPGTPAAALSSWLLTVQLESGEGLDDGIKRLIASVPAGPTGIGRLATTYEAQLRVAMHSDTWNTSFGLYAQSVSVLASIAVSVVFDLYLYGGAHDA